MNVLIGLDERTSMKFALSASDRTSSNENTIAKVHDALMRFGHFGPVELHSDGEPALMDLCRRVAGRRSAQTFLRTSPPHDSASNGRIERCVRSVEEACRATKLALEKRLGRRLSVHDRIFNGVYAIQFIY